MDAPLIEDSDSDDTELGRAFVASEGDVGLMLRVARGEPRARRTLAQRLVGRVRRAAYALMGPVPEAEEAAVSALTELVRSAATFPRDLSLYAWCDRLTSKSVVRFAHAMRAPRAASDADPSATTGLQSLEDLLARLPTSTREIFALIHVFGVPMRDVVALVGSSEVGVREELEHARAALLSLVHRGQHAHAELHDVRRFWAQWERARDIVDRPLTEEEQAELAALGAFAPELLRLVAEARHFLEAANGARATPQDRAVLARVLSGLASSSSNEGERDRNGSSEPPFELDGPGWVPPVCVGLSCLMLVAAFVALRYHEPQVIPRAITPRPAPAARTAAAVAVPPTVEALPKAVTSERGAPVHRAGEALPSHTPLYEGEILRAPEGASCLRIEPDTEICLGIGSELLLTRLARDARTLTLAHGRVVLALEGQAAPVHLVTGPLTLVAERGTFGVERDEQGIVVRALLGRAEVRAYGHAHELAAGALIARDSATGLEVAALVPEKVRRDWELFAAHRPAPKPLDAALLGRPKNNVLAEPAAPVDDVAAPRPTTPRSADVVGRELPPGTPAWPSAEIR